MALVSEIKTKIQARQKQSLLDVAECSGLAYDQLARIKIDRVNDEERLRRNAFIRHAINPYLARPADFDYPFPLKSVDDYWQYCDVNSRGVRENAISLLIGACSLAFPSCLEFAQADLSRRLAPLCAGLHGSEDVASLLGRIPVVHLSDQDFELFGLDEKCDFDELHVRRHIGAEELIRVLAKCLVSHGALDHEEPKTWPIRRSNTVLPRQPGDIIEQLAEIFQDVREGRSVLNGGGQACDKLISGNKQVLSEMISIGGELVLWIRAYARIILRYSNRGDDSKPTEPLVDSMVMLCLSRLSRSVLSEAMIGCLMLYSAVLVLDRIGACTNQEPKDSLEDRLELMTFCADRALDNSVLYEHYCLQKFLLAPLLVYGRMCAGVTVEEACSKVYKRILKDKVNG